MYLIKDITFHLMAYRNKRFWYIYLFISQGMWQQMSKSDYMDMQTELGLYYLYITNEPLPVAQLRDLEDKIFSEWPKKYTISHMI